MANSSLHTAKNDKNDEFYTKLSEIQAEINNYIDKFKDKIVFCNCDDPFESNFVKYFLMNFNRLGLKELIATGYKTSTIGGSEIGEKNIPYALRVSSTKKYLTGTQKDLDIASAKYFLSVEGNKIMTPLIGNIAKDENGNKLYFEVKEKYTDLKGKEKIRKVKKELFYEAGDFRSDESISLLKQADIVVTNPPFSLFREYIATLIKYEKKFLILGNMNAITYKEFFPLLKNNKVWLGCNNGSKEYMVVESYAKMNPTKVYKKGNNYYSKLGNTAWYTNLDHIKRHTMLPLDLGYTYCGHEDMYPKYDNYDAINVDKVSQIPCDYMGCIGVPISFLEKYCPEQFEIVRFRKGNDDKDLVYIKLNNNNRTEQNRTEQNRTEQNRTEQNRTEQNRTEQNRTGYNLTSESLSEEYYNQFSGKERTTINGKLTYARVFIRRKVKENINK